MNKLVLSLAITSALGLIGCDSESIQDVQDNVTENNTQITAPARVVFDPSNGVLSVPNDLLFQGTQDGTLNIPVEDPTNGSDPYVALNALDGWSTANPFVLNIDFPAGTSLDGDSVFNPGSVRIFETTMGGDATDADCASVERGLACKIVGELIYTQDFITQKSGNSIAVVPLKPLKGATTYVLALTNNLKDDNGKAIAGSSTYDLVRQDINSKPLGSEAQLGLQAVINSYEAAVVSAGVDSDSIIYTMAMTTQSTTNVLTTVKGLMAANLAQGGMPPIVSINPAAFSVNDVFLSQGLVLSAGLQALYSTANYHTGAVSLPYYSGIPTATNPLAPVNDWWKSRCDSGAMIAGLAATNPAAIPANPLDANDGFCMAVGLRDLSSAFVLDADRHLSKYSPVPAPRPESNIPYISNPGQLDVQMTTPAISPVTDAVRASFGLPALAAEPDNGWPVVILQHGITSKKEDMLAMTGVLSTFGFATIAIDHPLHGSRGFDLDNDGTDDINASTVSATHYMNLASLLTTRDNLRQSVADMLGLRLGLNAVVGANIDTSNVNFLGHSLGAITGINLVAIANTPINPALDPMFKISSSSLASPGVMVANFLMESGAFGDVIKASLTKEQSPEFQGFLASMYENPTEAELVGAYQMFYANLTAEQQGGLEGLFAQFAFAAQTVTDAGDPINYISAMAATQTPTHLTEIVGNGSDNLSDQVIPNTVSSAPLSGTEAAIALLGLPSVSNTTQGSGAVRFLFGHHGSILTPNLSNGATDPVMSARATQEMQSQVVGFFASMGQLIQVTDVDVVN